MPLRPRPPRPRRRIRPRPSTSSSGACRPATTPSSSTSGPVVGSNVTFFGEHLGCRIRVEDVAADIDRHVKERHPRSTRRRSSPDGSRRRRRASTAFSAGTCSTTWTGRAAQALADALCRLLRPEGLPAGLLQHRTILASRSTRSTWSSTRPRCATGPTRRCAPRQRSLLNGDIIKLFKSLRVTDSFLMKSNVREMLFRKPAPRV